MIVSGFSWIFSICEIYWKYKTADHLVFEKTLKEKTPTEGGELVQNCLTIPTGHVAEWDAKERQKRQIEDLVIPNIILLP